MELSQRSKPYIIPEYSLTGDLISFLTCNLQYRYQNRGTLPPSMPIQLWFGEFIHGVMEESFIEWNIKKNEFPWNWKEQIRPIEEMIDKRLRARGLYPPLDFFCKFKKPGKDVLSLCPDEFHPHKLLYSARAEKAINVWGPDLFPLIDSAEVLIKGKRNMPHFDSNNSRSNYYGINGIIDVISSLKINKINDNKIITYLKSDKNISNKFNSSKYEEYEVIIDYKGMKRPPLESGNWLYHQWQLLTYAWLRSKQEDAKPIIGGIIFYLNELVPSTEDLIALKQDILNKTNDVEISDFESNKIRKWDKEKVNYINLSDKLKQDRSIRIINIDKNSISNALKQFDGVVANIEKSIINEMNGVPIKNAWDAKASKRTCDACDFKNFCNKHSNNPIRVP